MLYYKQSDLFTEAPQHREARAPVNEGELRLQLAVFLHTQTSKTGYFLSGDGTPEVVPKPRFSVRQEAVVFALVLLKAVCLH